MTRVNYANGTQFFFQIINHRRSLQLTLHRPNVIEILKHLKHDVTNKLKLIDQNENDFMHSLILCWMHKIQLNCFILPK